MRAQWWTMVAVVAMVASSGEAAAGQGRLEAARGQVRPSAPPPPPTSRAPSRPVSSGGPVRVYTRSVPSRYPSSSGTVVATYRVVRRVPVSAVPPPQPLGPEHVPLELDGPPPRPPFARTFQRWPYEARTRGWVADPWANEKEHRRVAGSVIAEGSYLYRGLWRSGLSLRVGSPRVDVDSQLSFYLEAPARDALYLGDTTINFAPVALPQVVWRVGMGARYMADARLPDGGVREFAAGWNMATSIDVFPGAPFVLSGRIDRGMLYQTPVWRGRATVGMVRERFELLAGYDHTQVGQVALGGPLVGLRAWL